MIAKKYALTFTDSTRQVMSRLIDYGYNIRDVLNAGIIMFWRASKEERGRALAEATGRYKPELHDSVNQLKKVVGDINYEMLSPEDQELVREVCRLFGSDEAGAVEDELAADELEQRERERSELKKEGT